jgi:hypothetical protein
MQIFLPPGPLKGEFIYKVQTRKSKLPLQGAGGLSFSAITSLIFLYDSNVQPAT